MSEVLYEYLASVFTGEENAAIVAVKEEVIVILDRIKIEKEKQKATGKILFDCVCHRLKLVEEDYFGIEFNDRYGNVVWLDLLKPVLKQIRGGPDTGLSLEKQRGRLEEMFSHRGLLEHGLPHHKGLLGLEPHLKRELDKYLFAQQIKRDLVTGRLLCSDNSAILLLSHIIQAEVGDFNEELVRTHLQSKMYLPNQELLIHKIMNYHQKLIGLTSAESDTRLLDTARKLEMYGVRLHPASDGEGTQINLAVLHMGILVFQGKIKINTFNWAKIRKLSFKKKHFLIKLHSNIFTTSCKDSLEFLMASRDTCKLFWKTCVEYHAFFRLSEEPRSKPRRILYSKGSSFRYSGRTQKQLVEYMSKGDFKKTTFERRQWNVQSEEAASVPGLDMERQVKGLSHRLGDSEQSGDTRVKAWEMPAQRERKESAVQIVFTTELERSKPEADPASGTLSSSDVSTPYISDSDTEANKNPVQPQKSGQPFQTNKTRRATDTEQLTCGNSPKFTIGSKCISDNFPKSVFCLDRSLQVPSRTSMKELMVRPSGVARPVSLPARSCLANHGLYQRVVMQSSYGNCLNAVKEEESQQDGSLQSPRRSHSQSDMKTLGLIHGPELRPLAHYLPLSRRQNPNKLRPMHPAHGTMQCKEALQTTERYISSGTESSDSDSEIISPYFHPCLFGKALRSSALRGGRFSTASLQLDQGAAFDLHCGEGVSHLTIYTGII
ncbi:FERM domain-containing protein 7-like [Heptranchias perlo]|uniref:FERM domain-containing protein 7-like n=1 Tax=Heptranchias perlo TaxID=212740 RepID=UPI00355A2678